MSARSVVSCAIFFLGAITACNRNSNSGPPRFHVDAEEIDFGNVALNDREVLAGAVEFTNLGWSALTIKKIETSCGCTRVQLDANELSPGQTARLLAYINPPRPENRTAVLTLYTNDPVSPAVQLKVKWRAVKPIGFEPLEVDFGLVLPGERASQDVELRINSLDPNLMERFRDAKLAPNNPAIACEISPVEGDRSTVRSARIEVSATSQSGDFGGTVDVVYGESESILASLPVKWRVLDSIEVSPNAILLKAGAVGEVRTQSFVVTATRGVPLEIESAAAAPGSPAVEISYEMRGESVAVVKVTVQLPENPGLAKWDLEVKCRRPDVRTLRIPLRGRVAPAPLNP